MEGIELQRKKNSQS